jgi:hypothetical protein
MYRRLYFLVPGRPHAVSVIKDLSRQGITQEQIHAVADRRTRIDGLPRHSDRQNNDAEGRLEKALWKGNLISFALAFGCLTFLLMSRNLNWWLLLPTSVMAANFIAGLKFSNISSVHLGEFRDALAHGEILLLVDVPENRVADVERSMHRHHPEAEIGAAGWNSEALGV